MKRRILALTALCMLLFTISAQALEPRNAKPAPLLSFSGTTAYCSLNYISDSSSDRMQATLTLYQGGTYVDSWSGSGTGRVSVSGNCKVSKGKDYTLTVTYSVNGSSQPAVSVTKKSPS